MIGKKAWYIPFVVIAAIATFLVFRNGEASTNVQHLTGASRILTLRECMGCHDKHSNKPIYVCTGDMCLYARNHSLLRDYPPLGQEKDYASVLEVEAAGCVLENGKTTCLSCHDLTKPAPARVVREGHALCFICHKL
jgi:hypothetical protein